MLTALRRLAGTWFARGLFLLLILSFAIWGIEDVVRNFGADSAVARVGGDKIELPEAQTAARREMGRLQRQLGSSFEVTPAMANAVSRQAVEGLVLERVQQQEAARLHLAVPQEAVRDYVFGIPAFQGVDGRFSRPALDAFLRNNGLTEGEFLRLLRTDLERQQLTGAVRSGAAGPDALTKPLLAWERERRVADVVSVPLIDAPEPPAPEAAQLRRYHENNPDRFTAPEYRGVTLAVLSPDSVAAEIQPTDEELRAAFEAHRGDYETAEKRTVEQALLQTREAAAGIANAWRAGADFAKVEAETTAAGGQAVSLGEVDRAGLPFPELAAAAFALPEGGISDPVQSPFGWHVLHVTAIAAGTTSSFDAVRDQVLAALRHERAADLAYQRANEVEDALAAGTTLAEAAPRFGLTLAELRIDSNGRTPEGTEVPLPLAGNARDIALRAIFAAPQGQQPRLAEAGQTALFAFEVKEITPAALRPFETVEPAVRAAFLADARRHSQEEAAAGLLAAVQGGKPLAEAAQAAGLEARRIGPFGRNPQGQNPDTLPPPELLAPIFGTAPNAATMAETIDGFAVAQVLQVVPFDADTDPLALGQVRGQVEQSMLADLEAQYLDALRARAAVTFNDSLMGQVSAR
jgi:peptidyl-prolyl cis-trans isomerase D